MSAHESLSPHQFTARFKPSEYGDTWDAVPHDEDFGYSGEHGTSHPEMVKSVRKHGIKEPVGVYDGHVVDGHHRVAAALEVGAQIPYEHWPSEMYEGQIPK